MAGKGNTRTTGSEQYYTPVKAATTLASYLINDLHINPGCLWLEPAGGTGAFVDGMRAAGVQDILSMDIEPKSPDVMKANFLETLLPLRAGGGGNGAVCLTNPPFGRNNSLSVPFFNTAAQSCDTIAFIVPRSWRKWSVVNRLDPNFHKIADRDIQLSYVDDQGQALSKSSILNTVFQVWQRRDHLRDKYPTHPVKHFEVVKHPGADASLTIFGRGCGTLKRTFPAKTNTTQMFIKADEAILAAIEAVDLSPFYTQVAYTEALAAGEINYAITNWMKNGTQLAPDFLTMHNLLTEAGIDPSIQTGYLHL